MKLWSHQQKALEVAKNRFALFFDPGTGKTLTALMLIKKNYALYNKTIIICPQNVGKNWENEISMHLDNYTIYSAYSGTKLKREKAMIKFYEFNQDRQFIIVNAESIRSKQYLELLSRAGATSIIVDESHMFKSPDSQQTKGLLKLCSVVKPDHLYLLTGTPAPNGEINLWSTFYLLRQTIDNFFVWRKKWFDDANERRRGTKGYWPEYKVREASKIEFQRQLSQCSLTAKKEDVLDLPPLVKTKLYCELSKEQATQYETMKEYLFAVHDGEELTASNVLTRGLRMLQILAGVFNEKAIHTPRLDALRYAIEEGGSEQFIIWTIFQPTYAQIARLLGELGIAYGMLTGEQDQNTRNVVMEDFQAGRIKAIIANPRAGGVGVNLTAASRSIHFTKNYNLVDDLQCEARNYRGGSEIHKSITRIDIVAEGTIDEDINEALAAKKSIQDFVLNLKGKYGR